MDALKHVDVQSFAPCARYAAQQVCRDGPAGRVFAVVFCKCFKCARLRSEILCFHCGHACQVQTNDGAEIAATALWKME